jgi:hypothetical protein
MDCQTRDVATQTEIDRVEFALLPNVDNRTQFGHVLAMLAKWMQEYEANEQVKRTNN